MTRPRLGWVIPVPPTPVADRLDRLAERAGPLGGVLRRLADAARRRADPLLYLRPDKSVTRREYTGDWVEPGA